MKLHYSRKTVADGAQYTLQELLNELMSECYLLEFGEGGYRIGEGNEIRVKYKGQELNPKEIKIVMREDVEMNVSTDNAYYNE